MHTVAHAKEWLWVLIGETNRPVFEATIHRCIVLSYGKCLHATSSLFKRARCGRGGSSIVMIRVQP